MTAVAADYDNDGWPDIYVACDSTPSWLFRNQHDGTFREEGARARRRAERRRPGTGRHGRRRRRLRSRRQPGHLQDALRRRHQRPLPQRRQGLLRRRHDPRRHRRGDALRRLGRRAWSTSTTTASPTCSWSPAASIPRWSATLPAYPFRTPRLVFRNLGDGRFEELIEEAGQRRGRGPHQPRLRLRRLRQRRRRRHPGDEHERAAVAAAQRRLGQRPLAEGAARRGQVEPQRDRRARDRPLRRPDAGAGSHGAVELLLGQRSPPAFRTRRRRRPPT